MRVVYTRTAVATHESADAHAAAAQLARIAASV